MPFVFSIKDSYRHSVEAASHGKQTVLYDNLGNPSIMNIVPKLSYKDVGLGSSTNALPGFIVGGQEKDELFIGTYPAYVYEGRAYSVPNVTPKVYVTLDQADAYCRAKGKGWHCMSRAEYAAIALWCKANGYYPRGNNNYGSDISAPHEKCRPGTKGSDGRTNLGLTGSGPDSWTHDGTAHGIYGLNGDCHEWNIGARTVDGEIQVIENNDAALETADITAGSAQYKAILQSGALVAPGTANTLKIQPSGANSGTPTIVTTVTNVTTDSTDMNSDFKSIAVGSGITIPDILKALALFPSDTSDHGGDHFWARNNGERCFLSGGTWGNQAHAGVFSLRGNNQRTLSNGTVGFRPAYVSL